MANYVRASNRAPRNTHRNVPDLEPRDSSNPESQPRLPRLPRDCGGDRGGRGAETRPSCLAQVKQELTDRVGGILPEFRRNNERAKGSRKKRGISLTGASPKTKKPLKPVTGKTIGITSTQEVDARAGLPPRADFGKLPDI